MSAELLRRAAKEMREDAADASHGAPRLATFTLAVADWLEITATEWDSPNISEADWLDPMLAAPVAVARAYLGES